MKNLSVSKIEAYLLCPKAFKAQYIDYTPKPEIGHLFAGNVIHKVIENALREVAQGSECPDWKTMDDRFLPTWDEMKREKESSKWFKGWNWKEVPEEEAKEKYRPLVRLAREKALPKYRPMVFEDRTPAIEARIDIPFDTEVGECPIVGYADLLTEDGLLVDWKTTLRQEVSKSAKSSWIQFGVYSIWSWPLVGEEVQRCEKVHLVGGEDPHVEVSTFEIGETHRHYVIDVVNHVWKAIHYGIYPPVTATWKCSPKFCQLYDSCQGPVRKKTEEEIALEEALSDKPW